MPVQVLHIEFENTEGALLRLIGLVERRGFDVASLHMPDTTSGIANVDLWVRRREDSRDIRVLQRQISRLIGVCRVFSDLES